jgi:hypothetical protein
MSNSNVWNGVREWKTVPRRPRRYALLGAILGLALLGPSRSLGGGDLSFAARMEFGVGRRPQIRRRR